MITKLLKMQMLDEDDELAYSTQASDEEEEKKVDGRPAWMRTLHNSLATWLQLVPKVDIMSLFYLEYFNIIGIQITFLDDIKGQILFAVNLQHYQAGICILHACQLTETLFLRIHVQCTGHFELCSDFLYV